MPTREQLTHERVNALIEELGEAGIIHQDESGELVTTRKFQEASQVKEGTPEPPAVTRGKVSPDSHRKFDQARKNEDYQKQLDIIFNILTGRKVNK